LSGQPPRSHLIIASAIVIAGILISASLYVAVEAPTRTTTTTRTVTATGTSSQTACSEITVNDTGYCSLDVTDNMTFAEFGYSMLNAPVTFMGVTFESTCQSNAADCPTESQSTVSSGVIPFELIFPDSSIQYIGALYPSSIGSGQEEYYLSSTQTSPRAGFLLEDASTAPYIRVILLVEAGQQIAPTAFTNSANNLQLQLYLNSSSSATGYAVSVNVDDYNILTSTNNLMANDKWLVALSGLDVQPCWMDSWPVGLAIASGHYTSSNITAAKFLNLVNPAATYSCPLYITFGYAAGYLFLPMSDVATGYGCQENFCPQEVVITGVNVTGYWNQGGSFTSFPRGTYTVLGEDEWGNSALAYFTVS
jgi:hypothetical protein